MPTSLHVALLRGINVGGKNRLPMADLVELFRAAGAGDVRTYIQSGNVVFGAAPRAAAGIVDRVTRAIAADLGLRVPVVLRSGGELARVVASNPFAAAGVASEELHVAFLAERPAKRACAALDPRRSPGDSFEVSGRELYLHLPNGAGRTKLTNAYLDACLGTTSTLRNWRTVRTLAEMAS